MFELSVALKYLVPRWRQLSVSIISLVSILVIALVVWLIVVFFSVKDGLEKSWVDKIIALTAPIRITPTDKYYNSYYHLIDTISENSDYTSKTIGEKLTQTTPTDPYNPATDEEIPNHWPHPDRTTTGDLKDLVGEVRHAATSLSSAANTKVSDYETSVATLKLRLLRNLNSANRQSQQFLDQAAYIGSFDGDSDVLAKALIPLTNADYNNILQMQTVLADNITEDNPDIIHRIDTHEMQGRLRDLFQTIKVKSLKTPLQGWKIPFASLPQHAKLRVAIILKDNAPQRVLIPANAGELSSYLAQLNQNIDQRSAVEGLLTIDEGLLTLSYGGHAPQTLTPSIPLVLKRDTSLSAELDPASIDKATRPQDVRFTLHGTIQSYPITAKTTLDRFDIGEADFAASSPAKYIATASSTNGLTLPEDHGFGEPILLPKVFKESGVLVGDQGYISYHSPTPTSVQEQRIIVVVAGFYDPGIMPIGSKYILTSKKLISMVRGAYADGGAIGGNGLNIRFDNIKDAQKIKADLKQAFEKAGISSYWNIQTYQEYEFTKDLIQQLQSEKNLFSVISLVIIIVACSNIISMLIILVNDKKLEIGILRSMGANSSSIALIFGFCGMVMGAAGSLIGIGLSIITLSNLNELVDFIGRIQGHDLFNPVFYGNTLPSDLSVEAITLVVITTAFISLLAGIVPAVKASMLRPSAILRAE